MKELIKSWLKKRGIEIKRFPQPDLKRRQKILQQQNINLVLDVGANIGQYAATLRSIGYAGKIVSFEPVSVTYNQLKKRVDKDPSWDCFGFALGSENSVAQINVSQNSYSSSILDVLPQHLQSAPESVYQYQEEIQIKTLDSIFSTLTQPNDRVLLKIDTQGFEKNVLDGAQTSLDKIKVIQLEMSLVPLYKDEMLYRDMIAFLENKGFKLFSLEPGFSDQETGELLQIDGIFVHQNNLL